MHNLWITLALIACGTTATPPDSPPPDTGTSPDPTPISIRGHCPGDLPGTRPPAVTITGHDACTWVWLTRDGIDVPATIEVCGGYAEFVAEAGVDPGNTLWSCEWFDDWGPGTPTLAVSMLVDGVCHGYGEGVWCP